jgi:hypothetical protein
LLAIRTGVTHLPELCGRRTEDVVRGVLLPTGLVDVKVAALDATWSGLRMVWRKGAQTVAAVAYTMRLSV